MNAMTVLLVRPHAETCEAVSQWPADPWAYFDGSEWHDEERYMSLRCNDPDCSARLLVREADLTGVVQAALDKRRSPEYARGYQAGFHAGIRPTQRKRAEIPAPLYRCAECGTDDDRHGRCPQCGSYKIAGEVDRATGQLMPPPPSYAAPSNVGPAQ